MSDQGHFNSDVVKIDESKYLINDILITQKSADNTRRLFMEFHNKLSIEFKRVGYPFHARTHIQGVTYFANENKAFLCLNFQQKFISLLFFTGDYHVKGLNKGNWLRSNNNNGARMFRITDDHSLHEALNSAICCYRIASAWPGSVVGNLSGITTESI